MNGLELRYFVLKPSGDSAHAVASRTALRAYATSIHPMNPKLSTDLLEWALREEAASQERRNG